MSVVYNIILITVCIFFNDGKTQKKTPLPFPHLIDFNESDIGKPYYTFDGLDYGTIPKFIVERDFKNCYEEYARCTRFLVYANPVCGYHTYEKDLWSFHSLCALDLSSCKEMKGRGVHMHGTNYRNRGVYFMGEGNTCEMYMRRIAEGLVPRDIRDIPEDVTDPIKGMRMKFDDVTKTTELQQDKNIPNFIPSNEYDYENLMY